MLRIRRSLDAPRNDIVVLNRHREAQVSVLGSQSIFCIGNQEIINIVDSLINESRLHVGNVVVVLVARGCIRLYGSILALGMYVCTYAIVRTVAVG